MSFGKPGRPPEDRLLRQREIFQAVSPLIIEHGARQISMRDAAHAACLSIGGLYHYFPTKRDLLLHGLDIEARSRLCADESERITGQFRLDHVDRVDVTVESLMHIFHFVRPSVLAALDLGDETLQTIFGNGWMKNINELVEGFRRLLPDASVDEVASLSRSVRRLVLGALIDREVDPVQVQSDLQRLIGTHVAEPTRQVTT